MLMDQRVFFADNGTFNDVSVDVSRASEGSFVMPYVSAEDYLYVASFLPFNHKHFDISSPNALSSTLSVDLWDGKDWVSAVDIIDQSELSGVSLAQDGIIRFTLNRLDVWQREQDSDDVTGIPDLGVYDMYWMRFKWGSDLTSTTAIKFIGSKFSKDSDLYQYYPDLNKTALQSAFESGKTDWEDQHYMAAERILTDLRKRAAILSADQIIDYELFREASVHKTAELIFQGLGKAYVDLKSEARKEYEKSIDIEFLRIDRDGDTRLGDSERTFRMGFGTR